MVFNRFVFFCFIIILGSCSSEADFPYKTANYLLVEDFNETKAQGWEFELDDFNPYYHELIEDSPCSTNEKNLSLVLQAFNNDGRNEEEHIGQSSAKYFLHNASDLNAVRLSCKAFHNGGEFGLVELWAYTESGRTLLRNSKVQNTSYCGKVEWTQGIDLLFSDTLVVVLKVKSLPHSSARVYFDDLVIQGFSD